MATFINENQKLHIFSKSPVLGPDENGNEAPFNYSVNKSGHTVTSAEVRSSDIPLFIDVGSEEKINTYAKNPIHNDIVYWGSFKANNAVLRRWNGKNKIWEDYTQEFKNSTVLKNKDDEPVIKIHRKKAITSITAENNAGADSGNWAAFVKIDDNNRLTHFVAPTDKVQDGLPSLGYAPIVYINGEATDESTEDDGYIANTYAGIIQFNKKRNDLDLITVTAYEYTGEYLEKSLTNITSSELLETAWDEDKGIKVSLSGNVFNPSVEVSANFIDDVKTEVENNRTDAAVSVKGLVDYINDTEIYSTYNENGITVTLDGTIGAPTIEVDVDTVTDISDAIAKNKGNNVVSAQAVSNYISSNNGVTSVSAGNYLTVTNPTTTPTINANVFDDILVYTPDVENIYGTYDNWQADHKNKLATADAVSTSFKNHATLEIEGSSIHVSKEDRDRWDIGGNLTIQGDDFINTSRENNILELSLNHASTMSATISGNPDGDKKVPTVNAVASCMNNHIEDSNSHITAKEYSYSSYNDNSKYNESLITVNLIKGFLWKAKDDISLEKFTGVLRNPGDYWSIKISKDENSIETDKTLNFIVKVRDYETGKVLRSINKSIPAGTNYNNKSIEFAFDTPIPCKKGKELLVSFHSSKDTNANIVLPFRATITRDAYIAKNEYAINRILIEEALNKIDIFDISTNLIDYMENPGELTDFEPNAIRYLKDTYITVGGKYFEHSEITILNEKINDVKESIYNTVWNESNIQQNVVCWDKISQNDEKADTGGFRFILNEDITCNGIEIYDIASIGGNTTNKAYLKLWSQTAQGAPATLVATSGEMTTLGSPNPETWLFKDEITLAKDTRYIVTFNDNNTSTQFSSGHTVRFENMANFGNTDNGFQILVNGTTNEWSTDTYYCPRFTLKRTKTFTTIPVLENIINQYITNNATDTATISPIDNIVTPINENVVLSVNNNINFQISNNENIAIVSYTPHIAADVNVVSSITNNGLSFNLSKKETTINGEYFFVLEILYIDKILKQVKQTYCYTTVIID